MSILSKIGGAIGSVARVGLGALGAGFGPVGFVQKAAQGFSAKVPTFKGLNPIGGKPKRFNFGMPDTEESGSARGRGRGRGRVQMVNGQCPAGYHPAKDGKGCVRNRHMNFGNGRATSRAIRRLRGAEKQFRHVFTMTHKKAAGKITPKRKH